MPMQLCLLKSKIHRACVTDAHVDYEGSLTVDSALMEEIGLRPYEKILCGNLNNGNRFETYVIPGRRGGGDIILNGATAHLGKAGDRLTIMNYCLLEEGEAKKWEPRVVVVDEKNRIINRRGI